MISIIVCSRYTEVFPRLKRNIQDTIGDIEFEIIWIDNSCNSYSIFSAYNAGVKRAIYPYLCFMHEDIIYHSKNWGNIISKMFEDERVGMLGIVGTSYVSKFANSWWNKFSCYGTYIQGYNGFTPYTCRKITYNTSLTNEVIAVDGLWLCIKKELFENNMIRWDDETFSGFHFYDFDISLQIHKSGYKSLIADGILLEHMSNGNCTDAYYDSLILFHKKWNSLLPIKAESYQLPDGFNEVLMGIESFADYAKWCNSERKKLHEIQSSYSYRFIKKIKKIFHLSRI